MKTGTTLIYFPDADEHPVPRVVYLVDILNRRYCTVSENHEAVALGYGKIVPRNQLLPHTPELWQECNKYIASRQRRLQTIRNDYNALRQGQGRLL